MKRLLLLLLAGGVACNEKAPDEHAPRNVVSAQQQSGDDFEKDNPKWNFAAGTWQRRAGVLVQSAETQPWALALLEERRFADLDVTVRFRPISGREDASGGILFRARDAKNYYVVRANALEDNFRLYTVKEGARVQIAGAAVAAPKLGDWHVLRVVAKGRKIQASLNGRLLIDHEDGSFADGYIGLWTKADSVTEFDDLAAFGSSP